MKWKEQKEGPSELVYTKEETAAARFDLASDMLLGLTSGSLGVVIVPKSPKAAMVIDLLTQYRDQLWNQMTDIADREQA